MKLLCSHCQNVILHDTATLKTLDLALKWGLYHRPKDSNWSWGLVLRVQLGN